MYSPLQCLHVKNTFRDWSVRQLDDSQPKVRVRYCFPLAALDEVRRSRGACVFALLSTTRLIALCPSSDECFLHSGPQRLDDDDFYASGEAYLFHNPFDVRSSAPGRCCGASARARACA